MVRRRIHKVGWGLLASAVVAVAVIVTVGAFRAHTDEAFNRWVGWATVSAVPLAALGVLLVLRDKAAGTMTITQAGIAEMEDLLAAVVLAQAQVARSRLIGAGEPGDQAANAQFMKADGRFREVGGASHGDLASVLEYYQSLSPGRLVVLGEPGAGKTVLVLELLFRLLESRQRDKGIPVPILISAAAYNTGVAWEDWLAGHLAQRFGVGSDAAALLVRDGRILPVVDGVDEMDPAGQPARAQALIAKLNASMHGRERAPVVVTCRRAEYQVLLRGVDRATHVEMVPMTEDEAAGYLRDQFLDQDEQQRWEPVLARLHDDPGGLLATQLTTPWRLTLALTAFREGGNPSGLLPAASCSDAKAAEEYAQRVDGMLLSSYVSAAVRLHGQVGPYPDEQVEQWLTALAVGLDRQARYGGSASDIQLDQWWRPVGQKITRLTQMIVSAIPVGLFLLITVNGPVQKALMGGGMLCLAATGAFKSASPSRLKVGRLITRRNVLMLPVWLIAGLLLGLILAIPVSWGYNPGLAVSLVAGIMIALSAWLLIGIGDTAPQGLGPRDIIRCDGRYGLVLGLTAGFIFWFQGVLASNGFSASLAIGVTIGLTAGLSVGATAWTRYHISAAVGAIYGFGPIRFSAFLDWAQRAGLLRISGVAYQFRHRQLQDWLTSRDDL